MAASDEGNTAANAHWPFVDQAKYCFEKSYPDWRDIFNASPDEEQETICVPDALDVLPNRRLENHNTLTTELKTGEADEYSEKSLDPKKAKQALKRDLAGQTGEDDFVKAFRQLKLGGVLILGFDTQEFIAKMNKEKVSDFDYEAWKNDKGHFECDAIFLHHKLGAFIIEVKGCGSGKIGKNFSEAANQLSRRITGMKEIYLQITGEACPFEFSGVICIPNTTINLKSDTYKVLGKSDIKGNNFKTLWLTELRQRSNESISDNMFSFLAAIIGYRSAKFVTMQTNAFEIYRIIEQQSFKRLKKQKTISDYADCEQPSIKTDAVILNTEQLRAVECPERHIIISGPPGTGKSTVMLLRALAAAELSKPGNVVVMSSFVFRLGIPFAKFISENKSDKLKRKILIQDCKNILKRTADTKEDDIFCDEVPVDDEELSVCLDGQTVWGQMLRSEVTGTTTLVITGRSSPKDVAIDMKKALSFFPEFHHIQLKTVIRGTLAIINEWKQFFPSQFLLLGHNVRGSPVERLIAQSQSHLLTTVERKVSKLLNADSSENISFKLSPCHIAILISSWWRNDKDNELELDVMYCRDLMISVKNHLIARGIPCDNIADETYDCNLIAIDRADDVFSLDWPVVIFITQDGARDTLVALSRCISKLIVINAALDVRESHSQDKNKDFRNSFSKTPHISEIKDS